MKMNKLQPHTSTWTELTNITRNKISQREKNVNNMIKHDSIYIQAKPNCVLRADTYNNAIKKSKGMNATGQDDNYL